MTAAPEPAAPPRPVTPVGILADRLDDVRRRVAALDGVDADLRAALDEVCALAGGLEPYVGDCTSPESPALRRLAERTRAADWDRHPGEGLLEQEMLSGHVEGQMLKLLVHLTRARRVLDVGMFTGYSALAMAEALPADGTVVACEIDPHVAAFARASFDGSEHGHKVDVRVAPAGRTLEELAAAGERFDLVFLDADKAGYAGYLATVLDAGLVAPDGVIGVDNTLLQGQPYLAGEPTANGAAIAAFNRTLAADPRVEQVMVPLRDGLTLVRRVDAGRPETR